MRNARSTVKTIIALTCLCCGAASADATNLLRNGGMESADRATLPTGWTLFSLGPAATASIDPQIHHGGQTSGVLRSTVSTRSYFRSDPIAVAPGEKLRIGGWVKTLDVPADTGAVSLLAEFARPDGHGEIQLKKIKSAAASKTNWQYLEETIEVPPNAATLRLRIGLAYTLGTCWWDDLIVEPMSPLAARIDLPVGRIDVGSGTIPITVLNRNGRTTPVHAELKLGTAETSRVDIRLNGEPSQRIDVPVTSLPPGRYTLTWRVADLSGEQQIVVPVPLALPPISPTHWAIEDQRPMIDGTIELAIPPAELAKASLHVRLMDERGASVVTWDSSNALTNGDNAFELKPASLAIGNYVLDASLERPGAPAIHEHRTWTVIHRADAEVVLNTAGFLSIAGKPIWPMGVFNGDAKLPEMAAAGFTVSHAYNATRVFEHQPPDDVAALKFLDDTQQAGLHALFMVPLAYAFDGEWDAFRRRIRMFRNHPALLAWDEEEGIARGDMPPAALATMRKIIAEEDPHHPFMVGDARDVIGAITDRTNFFPADQMDLGMWWWYPLPAGSATTASALDGEEHADRGRLATPTFLATPNTAKPLWVGLQAYKKPKAWGRYPTATEYRAQAYLAIIDGAKGLMWYGGSVSGGVFMDVTAGHWDALKSVVTEFSNLSPVLTAAPADRPSVATDDGTIAIALRSGGGRTILIAANRGQTAIDATITSPAILAGQTSVLFEQRSVDSSAGSLHDTFAPYAVHVYELRH